jgi:putative endonuclease
MEPTTHRHRLTLAAPATAPPARAMGGPDAAAERARSAQAIGRLGESLAARHLTADDGLAIIARNWRLSSGDLRGELDLVAREPDGTLIVVEVKTRRDAERFGGALAALTPRQGQRLRSLTAAFLRDARLRVSAIRLDVVAIDLGREPMLTHVEAAL